MYYQPGSILFIRVPRTASGAIRNSLTDGLGPSVHASFAGLNKHAFGREIHARLGDEAWQDCRRFLVVRNPWERLVSLYCWMKKAGLVKTGFASWLLRQPDHPYLNPALLQSTWLDEGVEVFRYEDLGRVAGEFGLKIKPANASGASNHRSYYDRRTKDRAYRLHRPDIQTFGYDF